MMGRWFKKRLREAREESGLTQQALADRFGVSQGLISAWEKGSAEPGEDIREKVETFIEQRQQGDGGETGSGDREEAETGFEYEEEAEESDRGFSTWLSEARAKAGLTRQELAIKARLSAQGIYLIETGKIGSPRQSTVKALEKALGTSLSTEVQEEIEESGRVEGVGDFRDFDPHTEEDVPIVAGVYVFYDVSDRPIYVGKASSIRARVRSHAEKFWFKLPIVQTAAYVEIRDPTLRDQVETLLIKFLKKNAIINKYKRHRSDQDDDD